jgi:hypothetical protein
MHLARAREDRRLPVPVRRNRAGMHLARAREDRPYSPQIEGSKAGCTSPAPARIDPGRYCPGRHCRDAPRPRPRGSTVLQISVKPIHRTSPAPARIDGPGPDSRRATTNLARAREDRRLAGWNGTNWSHRTSPAPARIDLVVSHGALSPITAPRPRPRGSTGFPCRRIAVIRALENFMGSMDGRGHRRPGTMDGKGASIRGGRSRLHDGYGRAGFQLESLPRPCRTPPA